MKWLYGNGIDTLLDEVVCECRSTVSIPSWRVQEKIEEAFEIFRGNSLTENHLSNPPLLHLLQDAFDSRIGVFASRHPFFIHENRIHQNSETEALFVPPDSLKKVQEFLKLSVNRLVSRIVDSGCPNETTEPEYKIQTGLIEILKGTHG